MIVTCPACSARYKIQEDKIPRGGAKITCPRCSHQFVFYRDETPSEVEKAPDNVGSLSFGKFGVTWRVRKGPGKHTYEFQDLNTLRELVQDGQVAQWDQISLDNREWTPLESIPSLDQYFWGIWQQLMTGELQVPVLEDGDGPGQDDDEDDSDAPTALLGSGSLIADEIRRAVADAATPSGVPARSAPDEGHLLQDDVEGSGAAAAAPAVVEPPAAPAAPAPAAPAPAAPAPGAPAPTSNPTAMIAAGVVLLLVLIGGGLWASGMVGGGGGGGGGAPAPRSAPPPVAPGPGSAGPGSAGPGSAGPAEPAAHPPGGG